jgi:predicted  nucleic acid-binding Zn-ribbon protein
MARRESAPSTAEALKKAVVSVFGYTSNNTGSFGSLAGPESVSLARAKTLASNIGELINKLNHLIGEESGVELRAIEFELSRMVKAGTLPEVLLLTVGSYGEKSNFLVFLEQEKGLVDVFRSIELADELNKKLGDIEEACSVSGLKLKSEGANVLEKFVDRFTKRIHGEVTQKKYREKYGRDFIRHLGIDIDTVVSGNFEIDYSLRPAGFNATVDTVNIQDLSAPEEILLEHLQTMIFTKTAIKTLTGDVGALGREILSLINDYTIEFVEKSVVEALFNSFSRRIENVSPQQPTWLLASEKELLAECKEIVDQFEERGNVFIQSGAKSRIASHIKNFEKIIGKDENDTNPFTKSLGNSFQEYLMSEYGREDREFWAWEFRGDLAYFMAHVRRALSIFDHALSAFLATRIEKEFAEQIFQRFLESLKGDEIQTGLLRKYIEEFKVFFENEVEGKYTLVGPTNWTVEGLKNSVKSDILDSAQRFGYRESITPPIQLLEIAINTILEKVGSEEQAFLNKAKDHVISRITEVVPGLADYIMSYDVLPKFLKKRPDKLSSDEFSDAFLTYIKPEFEEFPQWKELAQAWIAKFKEEVEEKKLTPFKLIKSFINFISDQEEKGSGEYAPLNILRELNQSIQFEIQQWNDKIEEIKGRMYSTEQQVKIVKSEIDAKANIRRKIEEELKVKRETPQRLREEVEAKKILIDKIESEIQRLRNLKVAGVGGDRSEGELKIQTSNIRSSIEKLNAEIEKTFQDVKILEDQLKQISEELSGLEMAYNQLLADLKSLEDKVSEYNFEIMRRERLMQAVNNVMSTYSDMLNLSKATSKLFKTRIRSFMDTMEPLEAQSRMPTVFIEGLLYYIEYAYLKAFSSLLPLPARLYLRNKENPTLEYLVLYDYATPGRIRLSIGNNWIKQQGKIGE